VRKKHLISLLVFSLLVVVGVTTYCSPTASSGDIVKHCLEPKMEKVPVNYSLIFSKNIERTYGVWGEINNLNLDKYGYISGVSISPNGKWLALHSTEYERQYMWFLSSDGQVFSIPWNSIWFKEFEWLNNTQIVLRDKSHAIYILNPFTGQIDKFVFNLPDFISDPFPTPLWPYFRYIVPSPDLSKVAYLRNSVEGVDYDGLSLWDNQKNSTLWNRFFSDALRVRPEWSSDSQSLAVAWNMSNSHKIGEEYQYEVSVIDQNGRERQITNFSSYFAQTLIWRLSWSPDQHFIAMWLDTPAIENERSAPQLFLLDTKTKQIVDLCVQGPPDGTSPIVWSPDSKFLAFGFKGVTIVNITDFTSTVLEIGDPIGWMKSK